MTYIPRPLPQDIPLAVRMEFEAVSRSAGASVPYLQLDVLHNEPAKLIDGMAVVADGSDWNPGGGAGMYARIGGAWVKL